MHDEKKFLGVVPPIVPPENYITATSRLFAVFINPVGYKGLDIVLALAAVRPDVKFLFVFNRKGFDRESSNQYLWQHLRNVKLIGPVRDMRRVYGCTKLVLAPSQWLETWGRIATEAHFSGIPVLASDRGGLPEAVGPGGICLPATAPIAIWAEAFSAIWDDPIRYQQLCDAALQYSQRREISRDAVVESFLALLTSRICKVGLTAFDDAVCQSNAKL
jgi:glycosyltransferase involved in cell wall biosynthesis